VPIRAAPGTIWIGAADVAVSRSIMADISDSFAATIERFSGFADDYDRHRPQPPQALAALLMRIAQCPRPALVVDLGSGTGLSSRYWSDKAERVVGIEPSADMRRTAMEHGSAGNLQFHDGFSHRTGLPAGAAQIVTCMQSLHWMEPQGTFEEARRLLRSGGVFAAVDYDWPPATGSWQADLAWEECRQRAARLEATLASERRPRRWDKAQHLLRMQQSGCFRFTREVLMHHIDQGDALRHVGLLRSQGGIMDLLKAGHSSAELGIDALELIAQAELGSVARPWLWSARVRLGVV
jgi:SAM-dependent methyltransferase